MRALGKKLVQLVAVLLVVTFFSFLLINLLPGDPVQQIIPFGTDESREALRADLKLDEPILARYWDWLTGIFGGDFGRNYQTGQPVSEVLADKIPVSLQLMVYAQLLALALAIPLGVITAYGSGTRFDKATNATAFGFLALPNFVLAYLLVYYLGVRLRWFPVSGYIPFGEDPVEHMKSMVMPAIALAAGQVAVYMRLLRSDMIATLQEDFITMAKSKGLPAHRVLLRHALRPSSLTLLTVAGLNVGTLIGGAVIIEAIFQLPGMGLLIFDSIRERQYVQLQSCIVVIAIFYVAINFLVDFLYTVLDPRIRHARALA